MRAILALLLFVLLCLSPTSAWAVYCGNRLVSLAGRDNQTSVWAKCGEPDTINRSVHYQPQWETDAWGDRHISGYVPVVTEVWVYNFGSRRFMEAFTFEDGRLVAIAPLGYGY